MFCSRWRDGAGPTLIYLLLLALPCGGFLPNFWSRVLTLAWDSHTHQHMTEQAILNVTLETLRTSRGDPEESGLGRAYWRAVGEVVKANAAMDFSDSTRSDPVYHFDSEQVSSSIQMLRRFWAQVLLSLRVHQYQQARHLLGQLLHALQDFYSHSNWVEMGQRSPYVHLLQPEEPAVPVAEVETPTCMECFSATCRENLLPALRAASARLLTTGYFSTFPPKPRGKCSHGGVLDSSRSSASRGGINKDSSSPLFSPHHYLHREAAALAAAATLDVLRDLRDTVGQKTFLRFFSVKQPPALVFVMDTTGSMFEEITAARLRAHSIIQNRAGQPGPPRTFLLVPFHDPGVGPVYETEDPDQFMHHMENLTALGGGDEPEMCFTALQLALTHSPPLSEVFVFTDASPKDAHLFDVLKALALHKQSKVTFLLTDDLPEGRGRTRRRRSRRRRRRRRETFTGDRFGLYSSLSTLSGGLTIFTNNLDIYRVSTVVEDKTSADKVTLLHVDGDQEQTSSHFTVDTSVSNVTLHISGFLTECVLTDPSGQAQSLLAPSGSLADSQHFEGFYRVRLLPPLRAGEWTLQTKCVGHFTFNVIGDSRFDFLYYFASVINDTHPGLARVEGSPVAGASTFLVLVVTGAAADDGAAFSHVTLLGSEGEKLQEVLLNSSSSSTSSSHEHVEEMVGWVNPVPSVPFSIRLTGRDSRGNQLERVSTEMVQPTGVQIRILSEPHLVAGHSTMVDFEVLNRGPEQRFTVTVEDDCGYLRRRGDHRFQIADREVFRGHVELHPPAAARAGQSVTLTLTVTSDLSTNTNYAVSHLSVTPPDTVSRVPSCRAAGPPSSCSAVCSETNWTVSLALTGLAALQLHSGEGTLTWLQSEGSDGEAGVRLRRGDPPLDVSGWGGSYKTLWGTYTSNCCSAQAQLLLWNVAGDMKRCLLTSSQQRADTSGAQTSRSSRTGLLFLMAGCCSLLSWRRT